ISKYSDHSTWFAFQLQDDLNKKLSLESRGVKFANFQVLRETVGLCPSLLMELGFLSNKDESFYISDSNNIERIALSILLSIQKLLKL
ncbi:N-acetylmuramoyl-L-alanine amidase family protein, partial [Sinomicrobium oceani]